MTYQEHNIVNTKDYLDDGKQLELINKIIDTVSIEPEN